MLVDSECDGHDGSSGKATGNVHMLSAEIDHLHNEREMRAYEILSKNKDSTYDVVWLLPTPSNLLFIQLSSQ